VEWESDLYEKLDEITIFLLALSAQSFELPAASWPPQTKTAGFRPPLCSMDARVKPGHDDRDVILRCER
jgi:hypothetical protein